jgi:hypothetical protein
MKVCRECNIEKSLSEFYKHSAMGDGHLNKCKTCVKSRVRKHRLENLEAIKEFDKKRGNKPSRVQARKLYQQTEAGKLAKKKARSLYLERHPMVYAAHVITRNAVRDGKLIPADSCSSCGSTKKIESHHNDYTKPLDVQWLCEQCHKAWHKINKPIYC